MNKSMILIAGFIILISGCTGTNNVSNNNAGLPNPASVYCEDQGYTLEIRDTSTGQVGYCIFDDESECEEWAYYTGDCTLENASPCKNLCGNGICEEVVCSAIGCPCAESASTCSYDC